MGFNPSGENLHYRWARSTRRHLTATQRPGTDCGCNGVAQRTCRSKGLNPAVLETTYPPLLQQHKGLSLCAAFPGQVWDAWIQLLCCCPFAAGSSKGHPSTQASYESVQWLDSTRPEVSEILGNAKVFYHTQCFSGSQSSPIYRYTYTYKQFIPAHLGTVCGSLTPSQLETRRDWSEIAHLGTVCRSPTPAQLEMRRDRSESRHRTLAQGEWSKEISCTPPLVQALLSAMPPSPHCLAV